MIVVTVKCFKCRRTFDKVFPDNEISFMSKTITCPFCRSLNTQKVMVRQVPDEKETKCDFIIECLKKG
ncbi:MAG TPA: hypothetical protein DEA54_01905 [Thermodesulfobacterium commune]|nr:hypothetical protein [Thermodesulfobacterium commune]HCE79333.1 hypothetical protein [Thermodesulfobacterium commune]